ncbi:MAG TPA: hypothetical protein VK674_06170 [Candidatus Limnocylindria bacterium]|nr:hypothetical protein [Candidatus Limnocylindria bacterium]
MASTAKKVNEKSTKGEIWEAYQGLLAELQQRPVTVSDDPARLLTMTTALTEAKAALIGRFDSTIERLSAVQQAYHEADQELTRRKSAAIEAVERSRQELEASIDAVRKRWEQENADRSLDHQREEDTYAYELARKRRDEEEAYSKKAKEREAALTARETSLKERETQTEDLAKQVEAFPARLEAAAKTAREELAKELKAQHANELKDTKQSLEHEKSILVLKLQAADTTIGTQTKHITELQRQLDASAAQLKEMAVAVIQSKNATTTPPQ